MPHHNSLIHGLLKPMPWGAFDRAVAKHDADKHVRALSTKSQLLALLSAQLSGATSLREIEATMASHEGCLYHLGVTAPKRSTLADANKQRPAEVFVEVFQALIAQAHPGLKRKTKEAVRLIDSTSVSLSNLSSDWAYYEAHGAGAKLHVVFDPNAETPVHFAVSAQRDNDITAAKAMPIEPGATYVFDLGYYDFAWWAKLDALGCTFVTRLRSHTKPTVVLERPLPPDLAARGRVVKDRTIRCTGRLKGTRQHPLTKELREVHVVIDTGKTLRLVSNDLTSPAEAIADLYRTRWQIELFFRWVKQTLKIKRFLGTSENAVRIQLAVACCCGSPMRRRRSSTARSRSPGWCAPISCIGAPSTISHEPRPTPTTQTHHQLHLALP